MTDQEIKNYIVKKLSPGTEKEYLQMMIVGKWVRDCIEGPEDDGSVKFVVVWGNPRHIEKCKVLNKTEGLSRVQMESNGEIKFREHKLVFNSLEAVNKYLETEDYRSIH